MPRSTAVTHSLLIAGAIAVGALSWRDPLQGQTKTAASRRQFQAVETTIPEIRAAMEEGRVTSRELVTLYLARIGMYEDKPHCIITVNPHLVAEADQRYREPAQGRIPTPPPRIPPPPQATPPTP